MFLSDLCKKQVMQDEDLTEDIINAMVDGMELEKALP